MSSSGTSVPFYTLYWRTRKLTDTNKAFIKSYEAIYNPSEIPSFTQVHNRCKFDNIKTPYNDVAHSSWNCIKQLTCLSERYKEEEWKKCFEIHPRNWMGSLLPFSVHLVLNSVDHMILTIIFRSLITVWQICMQMFFTFPQ